MKFLALFPIYHLLTTVDLVYAAAGPQLNPETPEQGGHHGGQPGGRPCQRIRVHKEWRQLSNTDRSDYIQAVKCLMATKPSTPRSQTRPGVRSRFDEFQSSHLDLAPAVHGVGQFLPWHRYFLKLYDTALREECRYKGPGVYWDWSIDADSSVPIKDWPIFDPETGFGGNGVPGTYVMPADHNKIPGPGIPMGCIADGPFNASNLLNLGVGPSTIAEHCLVRAFDEGMVGYLTSGMVETTLSRQTFEEFRLTLAAGDAEVGIGIHIAGHQLVGGEVNDFFTSPGDPLFYLHHANIDRIWDKWQRADPLRRMSEISGPTSPLVIPSINNVTVDFFMPFTSLALPIAIKEIMDIETRPSCFRYE